MVNTDPDKSGMVLGNLRIAEDRVLSYAVVLKAKTPSEMGLVPQAVFYFEAETNLKSLVLQRRYFYLFFVSLSNNCVLPDVGSMVLGQDIGTWASNTQI